MSLSYAMLFYIHANEIFKMRLENHLKGFPVYQMDELVDLQENTAKSIVGTFFLESVHWFEYSF